MPIPAFRPDGYLPEGLHAATEAKVAERFGQVTMRRRHLMRRVAEGLRSARAVRARRLLVDGSFVTFKPEPDDVDCLCWLPSTFADLHFAGHREAVRLYEMLVTRQPEELFGVFTPARWAGWVAFFSQTREADERRKGLVEVLR